MRLRYLIIALILALLLGEWWWPMSQSFIKNGITFWQIASGLFLAMFLPLTLALGFTK